MNESILKANIMEELRKSEPSFVSMRLEDRLTSGYPDIVVTALGNTSWWEVKFHDHDGFASEGIQELTMLRLAGACNRAFYIIFEEAPTKRTRILHPKHIKDWQSHGETRPGYNYKWVVECIRGVHYV